MAEASTGGGGGGGGLRVADVTVDISARLHKNFVRDLQKQLNRALAGLSYGMLSRGMREEGRRAGTMFRSSFNSAAQSPALRLKLSQAVGDAKRYGVLAGKGFHNGVKTGASGLNANDLLQGMNAVVTEAGSTGHQAGSAFQTALVANATGGLAAQLTAPLSAVPSAAGAAGNQAGDQLGDGLTQGMQQAVPQAQQIGQTAGQRFAAAFQGSTASIGGAIGSIGITGAAGGAFLGAANMEAMASRIAASIGQNNEKTTSQIQQGIKDLYKRGYELEDAGSIVESIASVSPSTVGNSGQINDLAQRLVYMQKSYGVESNKAMRVAGQMVSSGMAKDLKTALSDMSTGMQGMSSELRPEMLEMLSEYSGHAQGAGLTSQNYIALLRDMSKGPGGALRMDYASDALKEMKNLITDTGNTASTEALAEIGLDHKTMAAELLAGGERADAATELIFRSLLNVEDAGEKARLSLALIGTPLEELGKTEKDLDNFLSSIVKSNESLGNTNQIMDESIRQTTQTTMQQLLALKNTAITTFQEVFEPMLQRLLPVLQNLLVWMTENKNTIQALTPWVLAVSAGFSAIVAIGLVGWVAAGVAQLGPMIVALRGVATAATLSRIAMTGLWGVGILAGVAAVAGLAKLIHGLWTDYDGTLAYLRDNFGVFGDWIANAIEGWGGAISWLWDKITELGNLVKNLFTGGFGDFGSGSFTTNLVNATRNFVGLPAMATGGDVIGPTALIAGEKDPETIVNRGKMNSALDGMITRLNSEKNITKNGAIHNEITVVAAPHMNIDELVNKTIDALAWQAGRQ